MKKGIEIEVFVYSEDELDLINMNIEPNELSDEKEKRTFWKIDSAYANRENNEETVFWVGSESYITPMMYNEFVELVDQSFKL